MENWNHWRVRYLSTGRIVIPAEISGGHSGYSFGHRDFWINLSSPDETNPKLEPKAAPELIPPADSKTLESLPKTGRSGLGLPLAMAGLIILTIVLTVFAIRFMAVKKRGEERTE